MFKKNLELRSFSSEIFLLFEFNPKSKNVSFELSDLDKEDILFS